MRSAHFGFLNSTKTRYFCAAYDYARKATLVKGCLIPKKTIRGNHARCKMHNNEIEAYLALKNMRSYPQFSFWIPIAITI